MKYLARSRPRFRNGNYALKDTVGADGLSDLRPTATHRTVRMSAPASAANPLIGRSTASRLPARVTAPQVIGRDHHAGSVERCR